MLKEIPGFPGQFATEDGRIFSCRNGELREKPQRLDTNGYLRVNLRDDSFPIKTKSVNVHKAVLWAFVGPKPEGLECRHLNGNKLDNRLNNLCWGTHVENFYDSIRHGTAVCLRLGEEHVRAKLSDKDVETIRKLYSQGIKRSELAKIFNISWRHAADIVSFKTRRGKAVKIAGTFYSGHRGGVSCEFFGVQTGK